MSITIPFQMTPQNFTIPAGYNEVIIFDVNPAITDSFNGLTVWWRVYGQTLGIPTTTAIIEKNSLQSPAAGISTLDSPLSFAVQMMTEDTIDLLRNYYHEASIVDATNQVIGGSFGIMTVTATENRP